VRVRLADRRELRARIVGRDAASDIAVLKVSGTDMPTIPFGSATDLRIGDVVFALGSPLGLEQTATMGIVSAKGRSDLNITNYDNLIQTDAAINRGNSGGPLFNMSGEVIGVNTAILSPNGGSIGIGFAMSSAVVTNVVDQLIEFGETRRGWLGVRIQDVSPDIVEAIDGLDEARGALVTDVPDGPAKEGGVLAGDVITIFDGIAVEDTRSLVRIVGNSPVGKRVAVTVLRDGATEELTVVLGRRETEEPIAFPASSPEPEQDSQDMLGLTLAPVDEALTDQFGLQAKEGLVIVAIDPDSDAAEKGLLQGDVIIEANRQPVFSVVDMQDQIAAAREAGRKSILLRVRRGADPRFVALGLGDN
jgi:serine protease Do